MVMIALVTVGGALAGLTMGTAVGFGWLDGLPAGLVEALLRIGVPAVVVAPAAGLAALWALAVTVLQHHRGSAPSARA
jgi:hypothetical protein